MNRSLSPTAQAWLAFLGMALLTTLIYTSGLHGGYIFDDFPNIVDNDGVKPPDAGIASLVRSALSSPSSEFKRPLSSLTFAANYLTTGEDAPAMKLTNVVIHLLNGVFVFLLCRRLIRITEAPGADRSHSDLSAALVAGLWLLAPINLTAVLYIVQRMESLANLFVLGGLLGYVNARERMQDSQAIRWPILAGISLIAFTAMGLLAKETAIMLPMYAFVIDACVFRFRSQRELHGEPRRDTRIASAFGALLFLPMFAGLCWLLPGLLSPAGWSTRDFTLGTRLYTELGVVTSYITWILAPTGDGLSFYHDDWAVSTGLFSPWTTLGSLLALLALGFVAFAMRRRSPLTTLGIALFASAHLLTATILPLELVYEHRNYFASMGLLLAVVPLLTRRRVLPLYVARVALLCLLFIQSTTLLYATARAWDSPLSLSRELAARAPASPRAQYELGRTYIIASGYDSASPFIPMIYPVLERAARLKGASILPEQALIFLNARMDLPLKDAWWDSMATKLARNKVTVQDESALGALVNCAESGSCNLPPKQLLRLFMAAIDHPSRSPRLLAMYGDFAWNLLRDRDLGLRMSIEAMHSKPDEPAYRITVIKMLATQERLNEAKAELATLKTMNVAGSLNGPIIQLSSLTSH